MSPSPFDCGRLDRVVGADGDLAQVVDSQFNVPAQVRCGDTVDFALMLDPGSAGERLMQMQWRDAGLLSAAPWLVSFGSANLAGFLADQIPLVAIPHRIGLAVREILVLQGRLRRIPGKRPQGVVARLAFNDALAYLNCRCEVTGGGRKVLDWWERFARDNDRAKTAEEGRNAGAKRPRPRKRRGKRGKCGGRDGAPA